MAELTVFIVTPAGAPLTGPAGANIPEIEITRIDTQVVVQAFTDMTEIGSGNYSFTFAPTDGIDYTFTVDADPAAIGQASPRYFGGTISGAANARVLTDIVNILADTAAMQPLIDVATSTRAAPGDAMALTAGAVISLVDDIWDEDLVAAHGTADTAGLLLRALGALISQRANTPTLNGLLGVPDSAGVDLVDRIATFLETAGPNPHGTGAWDATASAAVIADAVWDENIVSAHGAASSAGLLVRVLGEDISTRANNPTLNDLLGIADAVGVDLPEQINTELEVTQGHGAGSWQSAVPPTVGAIADAVWDENIVSAHGAASAAGLLVRVLGADISTRVNNPTLDALLGVTDSAGVDLPEQVNTELEVTQGHGAGAWTTATGFSTHSPADVADAVWDEDIVATHGAVSSAGLLLRALGAAISTRANNPTLDALLGVLDAAGVDLPEQVNTELETVQSHGAGSWQSAVPPTVGAIADAVWDEDVVAAHGTSDTSGLLLRALGALLSQRTNNPTLDGILGVPDTAGADVPGQTTDEVWDEAQADHVAAGSMGAQLNQAADPGGEIKQGWTYDQGTDTLIINASLRDKFGERDTSVDTSTVELFDSAGVSQGTAADATADAEGVFRFSLAAPALAIGENAFYSLVQINDTSISPTRTVRGITKITIVRTS